MKTVLKYFLYFTFFIFALWVFLPKSNLYYLAEKKLFEKNIIMTNESINSGLFDFVVSDSMILYQNTKMLKIEDVKLESFIFYSSVKLSNLEILDKYKKEYPVITNSVDLTYSVINPLYIEIKANGEFGKVRGKLDLMNQKLHLILTASSLMKKKHKKILRKMKLEKGEYTYEQQF